MNVKWYVNKYVHAATSNRDLLRDLFERMKQGGYMGIEHKQARKDVYRAALDQHAENKQLFSFVMSGGHGYMGQ